MTARWLLFMLLVLPLCLWGCGQSEITTTTTSTTSTTTVKSWQIVGSAGFTGTTEVEEAIIATDSAGTPYIAFSDGLPDQKPAVMKFSGGSWSDLGSRGFGLTTGSDYTSGSLSLTVSNNVPFVAFKTTAQLLAAKFSSEAWTSLGSPSWTQAASFPSIFANTSGQYIGYQLTATTQANIKTFIDPSWGVVGTPNFSDGDARYMSLYVNGTTPYLAFSDFAHSQRISVIKYNGIDWSYLGSTGGVSTDSVAWPSLFVDSGTAYVALLNSAETVSVMKFNGTNWTLVGSAAASAGQAGFPSLYIYNGTPYVAFADAAASNEATVMKYTGSWEVVGAAGFSADAMTRGIERTVSLTISPAGVPYIAVRGQHSGLNRLTVYKYN
ncbi:MAG: hypothetical protein PHG97_03555 [Candidatus Margulisbacteria bacterium]|nr:hypothetical protein [Candidatus Margulisiibacteriota bacterium]